jgi:hypothetical protein
MLLGIMRDDLPDIIGKPVFKAGISKIKPEHKIPFISSKSVVNTLS